MDYSLWIFLPLQLFRLFIRWNVSIFATRPAFLSSEYAIDYFVKNNWTMRQSLSFKIPVAFVHILLMSPRPTDNVLSSILNMVACGVICPFALSKSWGMEKVELSAKRWIFTLWLEVTALSCSTLMSFHAYWFVLSAELQIISGWTLFLFFILFHSIQDISAHSRHSNICLIIKDIISVLKQCMLYPNHHERLEILLATWLGPAKKASGIVGPGTWNSW